MGDAKRKTRSWSSYVWDSWDKSPEERRFVRRLDACLITYATLSYFSKYVDLQNVTNAYVSGMKEDLDLHGNQLNYITTAWTVGYVVGQIPSNMLLTRIRPSIWIPAMELIWSSLTMCLALSKSFSTLCAIRFLVGLAESTFSPGIQYVIGSWYKKEELAKRTCLFHTASAIGPMVSGLLQAGLNHLNALLGFIIMPDLPTTTKPSIFITQEHLDMAIERMESEGRKPPEKFTKKKVFNFFSTWHLYALVPLHVLFNNGVGVPSMIFWLKSFNTPGHTVYTIAQINTYPLGIYSIQIVTTLIYAWWSDAVMARWPPIVFAGIWATITYAVLAATPVYTHIARRWIFYYFTGFNPGLSGVIMAWVHELNSHDSEKRAFTIATCNAVGYVFQAWLPIVIFPQVQQPRVFVGNIATACINFAMIIVAFITLFLQRRDEKRAAKDEKRMPGDVRDVGQESTGSIHREVQTEEDVS